MKVLSFNVGYFLGFRSQREWLRRPHRLFVGSDGTERRAMAAVVDLVAAERPDVVALQEVDQGSFRAGSEDQAHETAEAVSDAGLEYQYRVDTKYGPDRLVSDLPVLRHMSNMLLWQEGTADARYLSHGTKQLAHVLEREDGPTVLAVHLSKTRATREKQLQRLAEMAAGREPVVLAGDFNVKDPAEFEPLTEGDDFELHVPGQSFSTAYPSYAYDVFLTSPGLEVGRCEVLDGVTVSDHMPVVAEVTTA